jgi:methylthioribulose-1-phosphate dehydratase
MSAENEFNSLAEQLIEAGRIIDSRGWVPATSGNFSARLSNGNFAITVSGKHKGHLQTDDIMQVDMHGISLDGKKPSAETILHTALYNRYPEIHCILHPHTLHATLISRLFTTACILENYELLKAFDGITTHESRVIIPIFSNSQDIPSLAAKVDDYLDQNGKIYGYIIEGHGLYTWGSTVDDTLRHLEALDYLFECELRLQGVKKS